VYTLTDRHGAGGVLGVGRFGTIARVGGGVVRYFQVGVVRLRAPILGKSSSAAPSMWLHRDNWRTG